MKYKIPCKSWAAILLLSSSAWLAAAEPGQVDADNTQKNARDRSGETLTAADQSNRPEDLKITQMIRQAIVKDDSLSMLAKNVKIITVDGNVTLRGPVHTAEEKAKIGALAKSTAKPGKVINHLEIKTNSKN